MSPLLLGLAIVLVRQSESSLPPQSRSRIKREQILAKRSANRAARAKAALLKTTRAADLPSSGQNTRIGAALLKTTTIESNFSAARNPTLFIDASAHKLAPLHGAIAGGKDSLADHLAWLDARAGSNGTAVSWRPELSQAAFESGLSPGVPPLGLTLCAAGVPGSDAFRTACPGLCSSLPPSRSPATGTARADDGLVKLSLDSSAEDTLAVMDRRRVASCAVEGCHRCEGHSRNGEWVARPDWEAEPNPRSFLLRSSDPGVNHAERERDHRKHNAVCSIACAHPHFALHLHPICPPSTLNLCDWLGGGTASGRHHPPGPATPERGGPSAPN